MMRTHLRQTAVMRASAHFAPQHRKLRPRLAASNGWSSDQQAIWNEIVGLIPVGAAAHAHRILVGMLVGLIAQVRGDRERLNAATAAQIRARESRTRNGARPLSAAKSRRASLTGLT